MGKKKESFVWRVTRKEGGKVNLAFGQELSDSPFDDDTKLRLVGKALIALGTQLMGSTVRDEDDWDDDE